MGVDVWHGNPRSTGTEANYWRAAPAASDPAVRLYYYRHRVYAAELGTFVSRDLIAADINLYRYCGNDPISRLDPTGEAFWSWEEWKEWVKSWFTSCDPSGTTGALDCAAEACKSKNFINYTRWRRDHEVVGSPAWKLWDNRYKELKKRYEDAMRRRKEKCDDCSP